MGAAVLAAYEHELRQCKGSMSRVVWTGDGGQWRFSPEDPALWILGAAAEDARQGHLSAERPVIC